MTPLNAKPIVALVGATGAAGSTLVRVLEERAFPLKELRAFASGRSAGSRIPFQGNNLEVSEVTEEGLRGADIVFFAAGSDISRRFAPTVAEADAVAIDKSSAYRAVPDVPLIVPEVNGAEVVRHKGIISNPNCVVIPLTVALAPLHRAAGLRHLTVATYQAASGAGRGLVEELRRQEQDEEAGRKPSAKVYPHVLHRNVVPGGWSMEGEDTEEELKIVAETRRVLNVPDLAVSVTTVRVPVAVGHSLAVWAEFEIDLAPDQARRTLDHAEGVVVVDNPALQRYPTPRAVAGSDDVQVGRIRRNRGREHGLALFIAADNLRKGAATNAVQVAEMLLTGG